MIPCPRSACHDPSMDDKDFGAQSGALLITVAITMLILSAFSIVVVSFTSTDTSQSVVENRGLNAYYLAESGYRIAGNIYLMERNEEEAGDDRKSADDDKAKALRDKIDGYRFELAANQGSFRLEAFPYWFIRENSEVRFPGQVPPNFNFPAAGFLKVGEEYGTGGIFEYDNGALVGNAITFKPKGGGAPTLVDGNRLYVTLKAVRQATLPGSDFEVENPSGLTGLVPEKNGLFNAEHNPNKRYSFTYEWAEYNGTRIVLRNIKKAPDSDYVGTSVLVNANDYVVFKKFLLLRSTGETGGDATALGSAARSVNFYTPITDSLLEAEPEIIKLQDDEDLKQWNTGEFKPGDIQVATLEVSGGGTNTYVNFNKVKTYDSNRYGYGSICLNKPADFTRNWLLNRQRLDYDVQVKLGTGNYLMHGAAGITLRNTTDGRIGVSFMKYFHPFLPFVASRTEPLKDGDIITGATSGASAEVDGAPLVTRGSWPGGDAQGEFRVRGVVAGKSGPFLEAEGLLVNGETVPSVQIYNDPVLSCSARDERCKTYKIADTLNPGYNDMIPAEMKPPVITGAATAPFKTGQDILILLWEEKGPRSRIVDRRWLAYKIVNLDRFVIGDQDYVDGNIVNDDATLMVRIREGYEERAGSPVKVNQINVFYGDRTRVKKPPVREQNHIAYDIESLRQEYSRQTQIDTTAFIPRWPPRRLENWSPTTDYFTHLEEKLLTLADSSPYSCDWIVNPSATGAYDAKNPVFLFSKEADGTILLSDFATPGDPEIANLSFPDKESDVCLHGYGKITTSPFAVTGFNEFALKFYFEGGDFGGFMPAIQE